MLRVFKRRSPMSVGAWTLALFSPAVLLPQVALMVLGFDTATSWPWLVTAVSDVVGTLTGLVLATYTGVLLGATAIPVWSAHARVLPVHFGASSLGAAVLSRSSCAGTSHPR